MSDVLTWDQVLGQFGECFGRQDYQGAYDLLTAAREQFPAEVEGTDYYRMCALARLGQHERVYQMISEKLAEGFWYSEFILRQTPSFAPLQGEAEFERLAGINVARMHEERSEGGLLIAAPEGADRAPAILALHGNGQGNQEAFAAWKAATAQGWLVAAPSSATMMWRGSAIWDDYEQAVRDVDAAYKAIRDQIDAARVILGGFSMGGQVAIQMALEGKAGAKGFIVLGPGGPGMDEPEAYFGPMMEAAKGRGVRGYIAAGDADATIPYEAIQRLVTMLNEAGIPCGFEPVPGMGHVYPEGFAAIIARGIAFIGA